MMHEDDAPRRHELPKFVRIAGAIWLGLLIAIGIGVLLAPHMGRIIDVVLHQTSHRQWTAIRLQPGEVYFDRSMPIRTIQSYYSALYRASANDMEALTDGALRKQMRRRMPYRKATPDADVYRSYVRVAEEASDRAVVEEKFHLFWDQGLRFVMRGADDGWRVIQVTSFP